MSRANRFKDALRTDSRPVALWVTTPWEGAMTILGDAGADAALIDLEHVSYGVETAERLIIAAEAAGISPLVRPALGEHEVSRLLDAGAHGIVFPQVETRDDADRAVASTRYRPRGTRGWGGAHTRSARWRGGYAGDVYTAGGETGVYNAAYVEDAETFPAVVLLVETATGVQNVDSIASVPGVDALMFGWGDFAVECGFDEEECRTAAAAARSAALRAEIGIALGPDEEAAPGSFVVAGVDSLIMSAALAGALGRARA
jgi:4-hydroxy-2-oxoheptanedioate aldolase